MGERNNSAQMEDHLITTLPASCYYIPNFITEEEENHVMDQILKTMPSKWTILSHRRLLSLPSPLTGTSRDTLISSPLPKYLDTPIISSLQKTNFFLSSPHHAPNHVLVNEYKPGEGIMPHEDGPTYFPTTATVSLGGHAVLEIYRKNDQGEREEKLMWRIIQEPRSLLVTSGEMYSNTLHGISEVEVDEQLGPDTIVNWDALGNKEPFRNGACTRENRISLTYRDVLKVAKLGGALRFMGKK